MRLILLILCGVAVASCSRAGGSSSLPAALPNGASMSHARPNASGYKQIFSFNGTDGESPIAPLTDVKGVLFGTTILGGTAYGGTIYKITTSGKESVVYNFKGGTDGSSPEDALIDVDGTLYGTANSSGENDAGTVFKIASGKLTVLYSFKGGSKDGAYRRAV
jgi:uncharacterized repeat protein (TIGR03803 family)